METRYLVMKISDMLAADLTKEESQSLFDIVDKVNKSREERNKPSLQCVVVESDWPEYKPVCDSIEARIAGSEESPINTLLDKYAAKCNESNVRGALLNHCVEALRAIAACKSDEHDSWECDKAQETLNKLPFDWDEIPSSIPNSEDYMQDAKRYKRLRVLGCAPMDTPHLDNGTVLRFTNLDEFLDDDIKNIPSRGES